mgnify:CR=1 FL=1
MRIGTRIAASLLVCAGLLTAFSMSPAIAQDEDFCRTYAYEALEASKQYRDSQCGGDLTKYSLNEADHYNVCMSWGAEAQKYASQSTNARAQEFYNCKAEQAGVAAIDLGQTEYENDYPRPGDKFGFCSNYAFWATTQIGVAEQQGCGFSEESGRWGQSFNLHRDWCMGLDPGDGGALSGEINNRTNALVQCQVIIDDRDPSGKSADECLAANARCEIRMKAYGVNASAMIAAECTSRLNACMGDFQRRTAEFAQDMDPFGKTEGECFASNLRCEARIRGMLTGPLADAEIQKQCAPILQTCVASATGLIPAPDPGDGETQRVKLDVRFYQDGNDTNKDVRAGTEVVLVACDGVPRPVGLSETVKPPDPPLRPLIEKHLAQRHFVGQMMFEAADQCAAIVEEQDIATRQHN